MHNSGRKRHLLITRPALPARQSCERFKAAGFEVSHLALIDISPMPNKEPARQFPTLIPRFEHAIFISENAVLFGLEFANDNLIAYLNSEHCQVSAIGSKTATALNNFGVQVDHSPVAGFTSEHLLALPALQTAQVDQQKILIIRGEGGRETLATTLQDRGATITYANVYRRGLPNAEQVAAFKQHRKGAELDIIALTSVEGLSNLLQLFREPELGQCSLLVGSQRIADAARAMGLTTTIITADDPSDESMLRALLSWQSGK